MIRGLYTSTSGMLAIQAQSEIIGDNSANISTPGYKEEQASLKSFSNVLLERTGGGAGRESAPSSIGNMGMGVSVDRVLKNDAIGAVQVTERETDLALQSSGYFAVQTPEGTRYTRNGQFQLGGEGFLQTAEGYPVLGEKGVIGPLETGFTVAQDGTVSANGQVVDQLLIVDIPADSLTREGASLYNTNYPVTQVVKPEVQQGAIEGSNVDIADQTVQMMSAMRAYEANQKVIQTLDKTLDKAVNEIGRV